jgi:hypothetical protein
MQFSQVFKTQPKIFTDEIMYVGFVSVVWVVGKEGIHCMIICFCRCFKISHEVKKSDVVVHTYNSSTQEAKEGGVQV